MKSIFTTILISGVLLLTPASFSSEKASVELLQPFFLPPLSLQAALTLYDLASAVKFEDRILKNARKTEKNIEKVENTRDKALCVARNLREEKRQQLRYRRFSISRSDYKSALSVIEQEYEEERTETVKLAVFEIERLNKKKAVRGETFQLLSIPRIHERLRQERLQARRKDYES